MVFKGGYNIYLQGRPGRVVKKLPKPKVLYLPLSSPRFSFSRLCVEDGQRVNEGDILAKDPDNYDVPLLAPRPGTARLTADEGHIELTEIAHLEKTADKHEPPHIDQEMGASDLKRHRMLTLGAWQFFYDAYSGNLPDPSGTPQAIIVSTLNLEPFVARGDVQLQNRLLQFTRGLEHLQSFLEYQPIFLILPDIHSTFEARVCEHIRGYAWVKLVRIPMKYPNDNFAVIARSLGLNKGDGPIWSVRTEGVLATDRALTKAQSCTVRIVSIGGSAVEAPTHLKAMAGYPVQTIRELYCPQDDVRIINGGILTGKTVTTETLGLDAECKGLTVIPEHSQREFLGFIRPGWDRSCYAHCFLSALRNKFPHRYTTVVQGEKRPCVSCNYCEEVCPVGIMPHLIHKYLYRDLIEEADAAKVDRCVQCGLCSFVCPSKIELRQQFADANQMIEDEKEEARIAEEAARKAQELAQQKSEANQE